MALKDWKTILKRKNININIWSNKKIDVSIYPANDFNEDLKGYVFLVETKDGDEIEIQHTKSKSQALKFAKSYMRTH